MSVKRKALCVDTKLAVIKALQSGEKKSDVAKRFNLIYSTVNSIWCARDKIEAAARKNSNRHTKKLRKPTHEKLDRALFAWFTHQKNSNTPVSGPVLKTKADQLANLLGIENYDCSSAWIERFKKRHNINFSRGYNEVKEVNRNKTEDWINEEWPAIRELYPEKDIFSADETNLFFRMNPNSTLECETERTARDRLTVFVCANATGTEKRKLMIIGKTQKNVIRAPVTYISNRNSRMTAEVFKREVTSWDEELLKKRRKIVLLLDHCASHPQIQGLKSIKMVFLPGNLLVQPMDQGVFRSLKHCYRKRLLLEAIEKDDRNFDLTKTSVLEACRTLRKAWEDVTPRTIRNSFVCSGLINGHLEEVEEDLEPPSHWLKSFGLPADLSDFLCYEELPTSDEQVSEEVTDEEDETEVDETPPTLTQARHCLRELTRFYECGGSEDILTYLGKVESDLDTKFWTSYKQKELTNKPKIDRDRDSEYAVNLS